MMKKGVAEIDQVVGKNRLLQESDIRNLPYLQAIVKESLRLHPVVPIIQRLSSQDCIVGGYHIPANTTTFINVWSLNRDPTHWENPFKFMPERYKENQVDVRGQHFRLLPFGGGRRLYPRTSLGLLTILTTLGAMIQCFEWKTEKNESLATVDMEEGIGFTLPRANPLVCIPVARFDPIPLSVKAFLYLLQTMPDYQAGYFTLFLICLISSILIFKLYKSSRVKPHLPPAPFRLPIIGHLHLVSRIPHQAFHKLSNQHGPVFRLFLGSTPCVVASSPETAKEILKTHENDFLDRTENSVVDFFSYGGKGFMFARYGSYWKFMKKIIMSELLNGKTLDFLCPVRSDEINQFIKYLLQKAKERKYVELEGELMKLTSNVISRSFMSKRCSEEEDESEDITKIIAETTEIAGKFNLSDHIWFCKNLDLQGFGKISKDVHSRFDLFMERIMREHEEARKQDKGVVKDLLNILLDISEDDSMEIKLTRENIKAFVQEILIAGTDTSAITIEWALAELINHPNIMKKAVEEIDQVVGKNRLLQESDIPNLPYLQAIVKESLRLHPTAPLIPRLSTKDCTVGGYHIPANTTTFINVWSLGRDPRHWESPLEFKPERFEGNQLDVRGQYFQLLPFGSGRRMCPGTSLGLLMLHTILGAMIQCFEWKIRKNGNLATVDMEEGVGITLPRANPLVCVPITRIDTVWVI
ncbi:hypothetical protein L1987_50979 [Smallanthus sonchifolius]|uniref:Uncharacterized protein n=1 Tax=Smallanthus sonchifolius TaxID=185202 RepID=A0ACB9ENY9_9ASTR|nr:hypothetical protein L1987_50979 [Smallanthus sonchifolius]